MYIHHKILFLITLPFLLLSCVYDDNEDCGIYLEFLFDYNMEYVDAFNPQVKTVDVYVFDENEYLIVHKYAKSNDLADNKRMHLTDDLTPGIYKIITVGGQSEQIRLITRPGGESDPETLQQIQLALQRQSDKVDFEFPHVWFGETVVVNYELNRAVWPVHLVRNTNKFHLMLQSIDATEIPRPDTPAYTFEILVPEAGIYGYDNQPLVKEPIHYHPYTLEIGNEPENASVGRLNTMRLLADETPGSYQLIIRRTETGEVVWDCDLIQLLKNTKPPTRPDDTTLPMQEYLDRQGEWIIEILYREIIERDKKNFVGISITINDWILWLNEMGV